MVGGSIPPRPTMTECAKCGDCCEAIPLGLSKTAMMRYEYESGSPNHLTALFINKWWRRISRAKYASVHPEAAQTASHFFYECLKFDPVSRLCTAHDERPPICSNYPWYGRSPLAMDHHGIPARCSFWTDVPERKWPEWVNVEIRRDNC